MLYKIVNIVNNEDKRNLLSNFFSYTLLQLLNYILPLLTIPYLVRVLDLDNYGLIFFSLAIIGVFQVIVDYGFNISATKEVAKNKHDNEKLLEIFNTVMFIKFILALICLIILLLGIIFIDVVSKNMYIYIFTYGIVIGEMLFPFWMFSGLEKMKFAMIINVFSKSIFTLLIFIFVNNENYLLVPVFNSLGFIFAGMISIFILKNKFNIYLNVKYISNYKNFFKSNFIIFFSGFLTLFYTSAIPIILGILVNQEAVVYFSIAEKVIKAITNIYQPISQTLFPYFFSISENKKKNMLRKLIYFSLIFSIFIVIVINFFSNEIIKIFSKNDNLKINELFTIMSILPIIITFSRIFSLNYIISYNYNIKLFQIYLISVVFGLPTIIFSVFYYQEVGASVSLVLIEAFIVLLMYIFIKNNIGF